MDSCKTKTSQETERSLRKFLEPPPASQVICTENSLAFRKSCEVLKWNHRNSTPHRSETSGIAERAVRRVKESTLTVLLQSGLDEKGWTDPLGCYCYMRNVQDLLADGKTPYAIRRTILKPNDSFWDNGWTLSDFCTRPVKASPIWQESFARNNPRICIFRVENLERRKSGCTHWRIRKVGRIRNLSWKNQTRKKYWDHKQEMNSYSLWQMVQLNCQEETTNSEYPLIRREPTARSENLSGELQGEWRFFYSLCCVVLLGLLLSWVVVLCTTPLLGGGAFLPLLGVVVLSLLLRSLGLCFRRKNFLGTCSTQRRRKKEARPKVTDDTSPYAHTRTFSRCARHVWLHDWLKGLTILCVYKSHFIFGHVSVDCSFDPVSSCLLTVNCHTDVTCCNQTKPVCDSILVWTVWPSGRSDSKHKLWAQVLHRCQ